MSITPPLVETLKDHTSDFLRQNGFAQCMEESGYQNLRAHRPMLMVMPRLRFDFLPPEEEVDELFFCFFFFSCFLTGEGETERRTPQVGCQKPGSCWSQRSAGFSRWERGFHPSQTQDPKHQRQRRPWRAAAGGCPSTPLRASLAFAQLSGWSLARCDIFCHSWCWRHHKFSHWC